MSAAFPRAYALSPWFSRMMLREELAQFVVREQQKPLAELDLAARLAFHLKAFAPDDALLALRRLRQEHMALCLVRDVEHDAPLTEIMASMTRFAEFAINVALEWGQSALFERFGVPRNAEGDAIVLHIIGMGKLGGGELNVSSDIDLIFLYPEMGETDGKKVLPAEEYFTRLGKKIINILNDINEEGQVFRVDMRLRPHGDSGPLVCSFDSLEHYLVRDGREWERYAWIKARVLTGNQAVDLQSMVQPFIFRKYLDFTAMESMYDLHQQIREQMQQKSRVGNIKLGKGGIREIEFIAQLMQLMRGGRRPELQQKPTCAVLEALAHAGFMTQAQTQCLIQHYVFLRRLEHRLQYQEDQQTQMLPTDPDGLQTIAASMSYSKADFLAKLKQLQQEVSSAFSELFSKETPTLNLASIKRDETLAVDDEDHHHAALKKCWPLDLEDDTVNTVGIGKALIEQGLNPKLADDLFAHARHSRVRHLNVKAQADLKTIIHHLLHAARILNRCQADVGEVFIEGDWLLRRGLDMLVVLARRPSYLRLLAHAPSALDRLARFLSATSWGAAYLSLHPFLLDELLDPRLLDQVFNRAQYAKQVRAGILENMDVGERMNWLRESHHAETFRLLAQELEDVLSVETLSDHLSDLADEVIEVALIQCWQQQRLRHCETPKIAMIAYGKLGGKELGFSSDVDLVLIRDGADEAGAAAYNKLAVSLANWLSTATEAGTLFETDYRLRPDGDAGQLVPTLEGFAEYQRQKAWLWEHQALTRARFCAGDPALGAKFEALRQEILCLPRDADVLRVDIRAMREKMRAAHRVPEGKFDLKHSPGGLVDIEFIVQWAVLSYAHQYPELTANKGNIALLQQLGGYNLLPQALAQHAATTYRDLRRAQHLQRLNEHHTAHSAMSLWQDTAEEVQRLWQQVFGA